ncbi:hypothetical protein L3Q82_003018 [Scortum barcoo]|uniref:Uncharacterized protein n=1 Tax=Scortum barcoo TaxID=214431 RepID=A0ACB8VQY4_9TELE|nr:hypothetical protein L3Q82_003018 [Scortum barcoo]
MAKRRLELETSDPQDPQDGGGAAQAKKPAAPLSHTEGKAPAPNPIARKSLFEKSRYDTSLGFLTRRFAELLRRSADGVLDLNLVAQELNAPKRRVYDVTNVLEGIQLIKKKSKNNIEWLIPSLKEQTVIVIKAPAETKLEVPHPEESLQVHLCSTQGPIEVFLCSDDPIPMEASDASVASDGHLNLSANRNDSTPLLPYSSFIQASSKVFSCDKWLTKNKKFLTLLEGVKKIQLFRQAQEMFL